MKALVLAFALSLALSLAAHGQDSKQPLKFIVDSKQGAEVAAAIDVSAIQKKIDEYTEAIKSDPQNDKYYGARGQNYFKLGSNDKAIQDLDHAIALNPSRQAYFDVRGNCYAGQKKYKEAYADFGQALSVGPPTNLLYVKKGEAAVGFDDYRKGLDAARMAVSMIPDDFDSLLLLGFCERRVGLLQESLKHVNKAIEVRPYAASAFTVRADLYTALGKKDFASRDLEQSRHLSGAPQWMFDQVPQIK